MGGYLVAKELLNGTTINDIKQFIESQEFNDTLASEDYSKLHPLHEDILRCFALLLPKYHGKHLHQFTKNNIAATSAIRVLFEISSTLVDDPSKELLVHLYSFPQNRKLLFSLAKNTMRYAGHPLNIEFWDPLLKQISMPERDLSWTELLRNEKSSFLEQLNIFEKNCKKDQDAVDEQRLWLEAKYYRWILTSTVRHLRDVATKALYYYGKMFPSKLFELTTSSLELNDPYIPERMLAASYGVAMALHCAFDNAEFREKLLPEQARRIYELMFEKDAPYSTTHILSRDYARRLIELALIHNPDVFTENEKTRIKPPFKDGGLRNWGESDEKEHNNYRDGSGPIHMDFGNYTIGRLIPKRGNYDFENPDYKKTRAHLLWRMYALGYSHSLFSSIDREISRYNWGIGRIENGEKIDRHGKKYSWIAFFELAGFRQDNLLLPEVFSEKHRISDVDIDPSFPEPVPECPVVYSDFLGDRSLPLSEWIKNGGSVDLLPYLTCDRLADEQGPWVLLDGYIQKTDFGAKRSRFIFPRGIFVKKNDLTEIVEHLKKSEEISGLSRVPEDYYTYAGEIPWCETFHENGFDTLEFISGITKEKISVKKVAKLKDGTLLSEHELLFWLFEKAKLNSMNLEKDRSEIMKSENIEQVDLSVQEVREVMEKIGYESLIPVRFYNWESYHSKVNQAGSAMVPAKELALELGLCSQPQTFNMYKKNGDVASITTQSGSFENRNTQYLLYLRQDLLDTYLQNNDLEIVWVIWGEREFGFESIEELREYQKNHESFGTFREVITYNEIKEQKQN